MGGPRRPLTLRCWAGQPAVGLDRPRDRRRGRPGRARLDPAHRHLRRRPRPPRRRRQRRQLRAAVHGVLYLHGGWSSLVDGLADVVRRHGGEIITGRPVSAVEHDDRVRAVHLADGGRSPRRRVVIAVNDPRRAAGLLDGDGRWRGRRPPPTPPSRCAWPTSTSPSGRSRRPGSPNLLGIDEPIYLNVPSSVAGMRAGRWRGHPRRSLPASRRGAPRPPAGLEAVLDLHQPDWRDHVVDARYVPRSMVERRPRPGGDARHGRPPRRRRRRGPRPGHRRRLGRSGRDDRRRVDPVRARRRRPPVADDMMVGVVNRSAIAS